jgi:mersacidin/lichenicidin family type 2 lantibiotic
MTTNEIVRSWKDEGYRLSLNSAEQALIPDNPAGLIELTDEDLLGIEGGTDTVVVCVYSLYLTAVVTVATAIGVVSYFHCR